MYSLKSRRELTEVEKIELLVGLRCKRLESNNDGMVWTYQVSKDLLSERDRKLIRDYGLWTDGH